ncbi:hypothetical protein EPUS_05354 [Endocarpon pusillum Z07020]|uniref:Uncharacterized protein n=1 Tax=Endocarpon pusillum (strain Z07020 / HMAS-L-300199) TaxID=1263415 RepID=U1GPN6_ENDPU|nr:uncharacterized protein EPUS_05354 [Endocarpon pusillum Z07020]ERF73931.1 hypothetical protein EPUS_05354 [Endocarpon pusillum Z07020]
MQQAGCAQKMIDEDAFRSSVLRSPPDVTEDELDHRLGLEAHVLGLQYRLPGAGLLTSSTSAMTVASDPEEPGSAISQSTGPTSCSSSDRRHTFQPSSGHPPPVLSTRSITPSLYSITEKKATGLRNGIRIMSVFRKRRSATSRVVDTPTSNEHGVRGTAAFDDYSVKGNSESPVSATSEQSSWSTPIPPIANIRTGDSSLEDSEAIERTTQCAAVQDLQSRQHDERDRFLHYQRECLVSLRAEHEKSRKGRIEFKETILKETKIKNEKSITDLEFRQLEAEMKLMEDLEAEKRACVIRLKHMEAYCHSPTTTSSPIPPPRMAPASSPSNRSSIEDLATPPSPHQEPQAQPQPQPPLQPQAPSPPYTRTVTEKDIHNLAQQYRERDTIESLHRAKIEVLRGRQEKQYADFIAKKAREMEDLEAEHAGAVAAAEAEFHDQEEALKMAFAEKKERLERRWRLETLIEVARQERNTGLSFATPPEIVVQPDPVGS